MRKIAIQNVWKVSELNDHLKTYGIELLYVVTPDTVTSTIHSYLLRDYTNQEVDAFVRRLADNSDVNYIDLREELREDGMNYFIKRIITGTFKVGYMPHKKL